MGERESSEFLEFPGIWEIGRDPVTQGPGTRVKFGFPKLPCHMH